MNITEAEYAAVTDDGDSRLASEPGSRRLPKPLRLVFPLFGQETLEVFGQLKVGVRKFEVGDFSAGIGRQPRLFFEVGSPLSIKI
jgi:hypothetical protein